MVAAAFRKTAILIVCRDKLGGSFVKDVFVLKCNRGRLLLADSFLPVNPAGKEKA